MWFRKKQEKIAIIDEYTIRMRYRFFGRVQGVGFRFTANQIAQSLGLSGWVKNNDDGTVTMEVQGHEEVIKQLIEQLQSDRYIQIEGYNCERLPINPNEHSFNYFY